MVHTPRMTHTLAPGLRTRHAYSVKFFLSQFFKKTHRACQFSLAMNGKTVLVDGCEGKTNVCTGDMQRKRNFFEHSCT